MSDKIDTKLYQVELEELTGKIYSGDFTPLVYDLLKDARDKEALLVALGGKLKPKVVKEKTTVQEAPSFDKLFKDSVIIGED